MSDGYIDDHHSFTPLQRPGRCVGEICPCFAAFERGQIGAQFGQTERQAHAEALLGRHAASFGNSSKLARGLRDDKLIVAARRTQVAALLPVRGRGSGNEGSSKPLWCWCALLVATAMFCNEQRTGSHKIIVSRKRSIPAAIDHTELFMTMLPCIDHVAMTMLSRSCKPLPS